MTTQVLDGSLRTRGLNLAGLFWLALAVLSTLPIFWYGLTGLASAWARPEFSHGPVIPCL